MLIKNVFQNIALSAMNSTIVLIIVSLIAFGLLRFATKILLKLVGFVVLVVLVLGVLYTKSIWPFHDTSLDASSLEQKFCVDQYDVDICDCIIQPLNEDLKSRFSPVELDSLADNKLESAYVLKLSLSQIKEEAGICLEQRDAREKYELFIKESLNANNEHLNSIQKFLEKVLGNAEEKLTDFKSAKKKIEDRY